MLILVADGASDLNDFHEYHIGSSTWKELSISTGGSSPSARQNLGFAATLGGLFVFGGYGEPSSPTCVFDLLSTGVDHVVVSRCDQAAKAH